MTRPVIQFSIGETEAGKVEATIMSINRAGGMAVTFTEIPKDLCKDMAEVCLELTDLIHEAKAVSVGMN